MRVALMIEGQEGVTWSQWQRLAELCEEYGYEGLFRSDHALSMFKPEERGSMDAWTTLSALAALTDRIRLGTLVSPFVFRHPAHLARVVASTDRISGGRVEVGIGAGWYEREHRSFGFPFEASGERFSQLEDYVEVVHLLLTAREPLDFMGQHYRLERARLMPTSQQSPRPPIVMGGLAGPRSVALAARFADEYNLHDMTPEDVVMARGRLDSACTSVGRRPDSLRLSINANVLVGWNRSDLVARAKRHAMYQGLHQETADYMAGLDPSRLVGSPQEILERLSDYADAGVARVMMQIFPHYDYEAIMLIGESIVGGASELEASR